MGRIYHSMEEHVKKKHLGGQSAIHVGYVRFMTIRDSTCRDCFAKNLIA
jgi:hypothetical protein